MKFLLNQTVRETAAGDDTPLVDYLRNDAGLVGTKIGCREGDCGTGTVLLGPLDGDHIAYSAINASPPHQRPKSCFLPKTTGNDASKNGKD